MLILNEELFDINTTYQPSDIDINKNAVQSLITNALQDELTTIDLYNSLIISIPEGYESVKDILIDILAQKNKSLGQLEAALNIVDPNVLIRKQAEIETLNNIANEESIQ